MKSLEHIIRDIREGKCCCEKKKDSLENSIRKVVRKESSYAAKDSKPVDEDVAGMMGSTDGKTYGESSKKVRKEDGDKLPGAEDKMDEGISVVNPVPTGNQFKSVRTQTPHIKPPAGPGSHSQAPENVSRQRTFAKERVSQTMGKDLHAEETVDEAAELLAWPAALATGAAIAGGTAAWQAGKSLPGVVKGAKKGVESLSSKIDSVINPDPEKLKAAQEKLKAADAAKAAPKMDVAPDVTKKPAEAPPVELPTTTAAPAPAKVGKDTTAAPPATNVGAQTKAPPATKPVADTVAKPASTAGTEVKPAETTSTQSKAETAAKAATAAALASALSPKGRGSIPGGGGAAVLDPTSHGAKAIPHKAGTKFHRARKLGEETRKEIENMPRKGDRKSIDYVGRKEDNLKTSKEKTSRLAIIKNVIDEAKKIQKEDGAPKLDKPTKVYNINKDDVLIVNPDLNKNSLDTKNQ
jgi:hypothetical protein